MPRQTHNLPFEVEHAIHRLGANIKTARLRRNITLADLAERLGVTRQALADVERGKPGASIASYAGMLWCMQLLGGVEGVADPTRDLVGIAAAENRRTKAGAMRAGADDDF